MLTSVDCFVPEHFRPDIFIFLLSNTYYGLLSTCQMKQCDHRKLFKRLSQRSTPEDTRKKRNSAVTPDESILL